VHDDGLVRQEDVVCTTRDVDEPHGRAGVAASSGVAGRYLARWVSCSTQTSVPPASPVQVKVEIASTGHLVAARVFTRLLETRSSTSAAPIWPPSPSWPPSCSSSRSPQA